MNTLKPGQTYEIKEAYIGKDQKLFSRVVIYRLTEKQLQERRTKQSYTESKKGITYSEKSKRLTGINIYVTNTPWEIVPMEQIHDFYSLRWQIGVTISFWENCTLRDTNPWCYNLFRNNYMFKKIKN